MQGVWRMLEYMENSFIQVDQLLSEIWDKWRK